MSAMYLSAVLFFCLGAIIASFIGALVSRMYTGQSVLYGRSRCDACGETLRALSLVPIYSFLICRGSASCCGARISIVSTASEISLGILFLFAYLQTEGSLALTLLLLSLTTLLGLVLYDIRHTILPYPLLGVFILSSVGFSLVTSSFASFGLTALIAGIEALFLGSIYLVSSGRAMGLADAPLVFGLAFLAGPQALAGFIFSFWLGAIIGIIMLLNRPSGSRMGVEVPFAPFLAAGFLLTLFTSWNPFDIISVIVNYIVGV